MRWGRAVFILAGLIGVLWVLAAEPQSYASEDSSEKITLVKSLTAQLLKGGSLDQQVDTAQRRLTALRSLVESDPSAASQHILPLAVRSKLPQGVWPFLEHELEREGHLEIVIEDQQDKAVVRYNLLADRRSHPLHFIDKAPTHLLSGARVSIKGTEVEEAVLLSSASTTGSSFTVLAAAPPAGTMGEQKTVAILVDFSDVQATAIQRLSWPRSVRTKIAEDSNKYYKEVSYNQAWLSAQVVGWYRLPITIGSGCPRDAIVNEAIKAADSNVYFPDYARVMVVFPRIASCPFLAAGTVGKVQFTTADGTVTASKAWFNGNWSWDVFAHELGHNLGLPHASRMDCGTVTISPTCDVIGYGDSFDIMGASDRNHFNAALKNRLGWFGKYSNVLTLGPKTSGTYTIQALESPTTGRQALRIFRGYDVFNRPWWFYIEYRQPIGFDSNLSSSSMNQNTTGAMVRLGYDQELADSVLLDMVPIQDSSLDRFQVALPVGMTFTDPSTGITMTPVSRSSTSLSIKVTVP